MMILYLDCVLMKQNPENGLPMFAETEEEFKTVLRQHRNVMLSQTDWRVMIDSPLSQEEQEEWIEYRKYLRDLMTNVSYPLGNFVEIQDPPSSGRPLKVMEPRSD